MTQFAQCNLASCYFYKQIKKLNAYNRVRDLTIAWHEIQVVFLLWEGFET